MPIEFALPSLGENVAGGDVLKVFVKPGDTVEADQPVLELETDKATIEVPSGVAGRVIDVRIKEGEKITVGQVVFSVEGSEANQAPATPDTPGKPAAAGLAVEQDEEAPAEAAAAPEPAPAPAEPPATPSVAEFALPELGENVAGGDVLRVMIKPGDTVVVDQPVLELETDKATIEVPSTVAGRVTEVHVTQGQKVTIGQVIFLVEPSEASMTAAPAQRQPVKSTSPSPSAMPDEGMHQHVGGTIKSPVVDKPGMLEHALEEAAADGTPRTELPARSGVVDMGRGREGDQKRSPAPASPSVRRAARELGVDIYQVKGTGPGGRISDDDVKAYVKSMMSGGGPKGAVMSGAGVQTPLPDFSKFGAVERKADAQHPPQDRRAPVECVGARFRTSRSTTRPTSPPSRSSGSSIGAAPRRRAGSSRSRRSCSRWSRPP